MWVWCGSRIPKGHVFKRDWVACSKYDNHYECKSQHNWGKGGGLYDHLKGMRVFTLIVIYSSELQIKRGKCI